MPVSYTLMPGKTKIEWATDSWNPVTGCTKVSQGCKNCYAERGWARLSANPKTVYYGRKFTDVQCHPERLDQPIRWKKPRRIFVNSMSDLFHDDVSPKFIAKVFAIMFIAKQHIFQVLTKRPENMCALLNYPLFKVMINAELLRLGHRVMGDSKHEWPIKNIWIGVSVEDQETAIERIPLLLDTPAAVRWLSIEPLLGPIDLSKPLEFIKQFQRPPNINWVVVGGESGPKARPTHPDWVRSIRDQCLAANVQFFFKQWGEWVSQSQAHEDIYLGDYRSPYCAFGEPGVVSEDNSVFRIGKKAAGRLLDGVTWDGMP